jgi:hypothetical protein
MSFIVSHIKGIISAVQLIPKRGYNPIMIRETEGGQNVMPRG